MNARVIGATDWDEYCSHTKVDDMLQVDTNGYDYDHSHIVGLVRLLLLFFAFIVLGLAGSFASRVGCDHDSRMKIVKKKRKKRKLVVSAKKE